MNFAIVDIETTGGFAQNAAITEIAIIITDGKTVIDLYETLINPEQPIPFFITKLTGITDKMVENAPVFADVAVKIFSLLQNNIFVAHNVQFDYSFVNHQLLQCDLTLSSKKLCTVKYGRKVLPGLPSYSLGRFCKTLGITNAARHRAMGDCFATFQLLKTLIEKDSNNELAQFLSFKNPFKNIPLQVDANDYQKIPNAIGVYYFLDAKHRIIYIGKAINLKKRISSHFTGNKISKQRQEFIRNIAYIKYEIVATELMSLILESIEIKKHWPKYNAAQKHAESKFAIYCYEDQNGYMRLCVDKKKKNLPEIVMVKNKVDGLIALRNMAIDYNLCPNLCMVQYIAENSLHANCGNQCMVHQSAKKYNSNLKKAVKQINENTASYLIIDEGLAADELSAIAVKNGIFTAMGYLPKTNGKKIKFKVHQQLTPYADNHYINAIVKQFATKCPEKLVYE